MYAAIHAVLEEVGIEFVAVLACDGKKVVIIRGPLVFWNDSYARAVFQLVT